MRNALTRPSLAEETVTSLASENMESLPMPFLPI